MNTRTFVLFFLLTLFSVSLLFISHTSVFAQQSAGCADKSKLCNPLGGDSSMSLSGLFKIVLDAVLYVGALAAVCFVIYAGFLFVTASGNPEKLKIAKNTLMYTLIGIAILFGAQIIVSIVTTSLQQVKDAAK